MPPSKIDSLLQAIGNALRSKDGINIRNLTRVEPQLDGSDGEWISLGQEVKTRYPASSPKSSQLLDARCEQLLPAEPDTVASEGNGGHAWPAFIQFIRTYLEFWRDVDFQDLISVHRLLSGLVNQCINSLANATLGYLLLPTTVNLGTSITRLAISLAKRPEPSAQLTSQGGLEEGDARQTVVESTAELLQRALRACFQDRTSIDASSGSGPRTKKQGIYVIVNLTMKLLFQCRRIQLVSRTIPNIASNSPALGRYPKSQRVTYLYYLGRYHFSSNHFRWAYEVLQEAYNLCYPIAISQKRLILIYLMSSSIVLGRFPSRQLLARPECQTLAPRFIPLFQAIQRGDLYSFQQFFEGSQHGWLKRRAILLPLRNRCEVLVWRSLCRRIFVINGFPGDSRRAPTLDLGDVWAIATGLYAKGKGFHMLEPEPTPMEVETIVGSLVEQGFMRGYISHKQQRFAILRGRDKDDTHTAAIGFPPPWTVTSSRAAQRGDPADVPGWVKEERKVGGMVVNLAGARPAGSAGG